MAMLESVRRALEKQRLKELKTYHFTAGNLVDTLYQLIDSGKVHANARVIINNNMRSHFMCSNCGKLCDKEYNTVVLEFEVEVVADNVEIFTRKRKEVRK